MQRESSLPRVKSQVGNGNLSMAYFADLTKYNYISWYEGMEALNIGWLDESVPFRTGDISSDAIAKLDVLCNQPVMLARGVHVCPYCASSPRECGNGEIRVVSTEGTVFAAPALLRHYVSEHNYRPPDEFLIALEQNTIERHLAEMRKWDEFDL